MSIGKTIKSTKLETAGRQVFIVFVFAALCMGCSGTKKLDKWVENQYGENLAARPKMKHDYLSITSGLTTNDSKASTTTTQLADFLPLIFYWQISSSNTCILNPRIPVNTFSSTVQSYANSKGLRQKLNGRRIELSIDKIPNVFVLKNASHLVWFVYGYKWDNISFRPDDQQMVVSYKIMQDNTEIKNGLVTIANTDKALHLKYMQSIKKATGQYLDQYDENIRLMSKMVVDQIITEI